MNLTIQTIETVWRGNKVDPFLDSYLIITNRMIIDIRSALELVKKGYYGSCYFLSAGMYRTLRMLIALHSKPDLCLKWLDEEVDTYQNNKDFFNEFKEVALVKAINEKFGDETNHLSEIEKLLHGSGFATRKAYAEKVFDKDGLSHARLRFGSFYEPAKAEGILNLLQGYALDNIGIFLEHYYDQPEYKEFELVENIYFMFINKAGIKTAR